MESTRFQDWEFKFFTCTRRERLLFYLVILQTAMTQTLCLPSRSVRLPRLLSWKVRFSDGFVLSSAPGSGLSPNSSASKKHGINITQFFFCFLMFPNHFPQDSISPWTGNLSLKIPNNVSCLGQTLKSGRLHFAAHEVKAYSIFLRRTNYWHNRLVQYMLESSQEPRIFCFVATRCQSMVRWAYRMKTMEATAAAGAGPDPSV